MKPRPNRTADGALACAYGTPWLDHFAPPIGTGRGCAHCPGDARRLCDDHTFVAIGSHCIHCGWRPPSPKGRPTMFTEDTPMRLKKVTFTTEVVDEETRRVVVCTFGIAPFTAAHATELNIKSLVFDAQGQPKQAIESVVLRVSVPLQQLTFAMAPDQEERRVVLRTVEIDPQVRVKIKQDRDPAEVEATLKVNFVYPTADELLYIANGVNDTHYLTFEPEQGDLLTAPADDAPRRRKKANGGAPTGEELRPGVYGEH